MEDIMIQIENVSFQYNNSEKGALKDVSISVDKGECVLLCGVSEELNDKIQSGKLSD